VRWFKGVPSPVKHPEKVDMVIFRENTEDIYAGIEFEAVRGEREVLCVLKSSSRNYTQDPLPDSSGSASSRSRARALSALCGPPSNTRSRTAQELTFVHKGNIMKFTRALPELGLRLAEREFADQVYTWDQWERTRAPRRAPPTTSRRRLAGPILVKDAIADITLQQVLTRPRTSMSSRRMNLNGDYLPTPSPPGRRHRHRAGRQRQLHDRTRVFEATHARPEVREPRQGQPSSVILSGEMMLRYMGWTEAADLVLTAMDRSMPTRSSLRLRAPHGRGHRSEVQRVRRRLDPQHA
jgi:isocitrate dehydrogenase